MNALSYFSCKNNVRTTLEATKGSCAIKYIFIKVIHLT